MKTLFKSILLVAATALTTLNTSSQTKTNFEKSVLYVSNVDLGSFNARIKTPSISTTMVFDADITSMTNLIRTEIEKLDSFEVINKYDAEAILVKSKLESNDCYSKECLIGLGNALKANKVLASTIEQFPNKIVYTLRLINVNTTGVEKTSVTEFLNIPEEIESITKIAILKLFNKPVDKNTYQKLTNPYDFDNLKNNPKYDRLRADGPRIGMTYFTGETANILAIDKSFGGFEASPYMFQFGYQFEKQYLNEGKIQGLFEFIPTITGVDQGYFIPSFSLLNGLRSNKSGWEFAIGPTIGLITKSKGYYDSNNTWRREGEWENDTLNKNIKNPFAIKERLDSRGNYAINTSFVIAIGKTFKSGNLNVPVNIYCVPNKNNMRFGASFGFNASNKKKLNNNRNK